MVSFIDDKITEILRSEHIKIQGYALDASAYDIRIRLFNRINKSADADFAP